MLPNYQEVKIAIAMWAMVFYVYLLVFGEPHSPFRSMGLKLQGLIRVVTP